MGVEKDDKPQEQADTTPLAPGVWVTESPGFACVPPRAQSDLRNAADQTAQDEAEQHGGDKERERKLSRDDIEPRIERYRER